MTVTPTWAEILDEALENHMLDVHTALPGKIVTYDAATQTAEIQLQIKRQLRNEDDVVVSEEMPLLPNVPIAFPRSTTFFVSFPLAADDFVMVIFQESSIDAWRSQGSLIPAGDTRRHTLTGAVALPCLYPNTAPLAEASEDFMIVGQDGGQQIVIGVGEGADEVHVTEVGGVVDYVAMAAKVLTELGKVKADFTALKTAYDLHVHSGVTTGTGASAVPTVSAPTPHTPVSVASSNLQAEE